MKRVTNSSVFHSSNISCSSCNTNTNFSPLTKTPISTKIALTGEVSLKGDIFPVGGLNEKLLAAKRMGITEIILPFRNSNEISELPKDLLSGLKLHKIKKADQALRVIFGNGLFKKSGKKKKKTKTTARQKRKKTSAKSKRA